MPLGHHVELAAQAPYDLHIAALVESPSYVDLTTGRLDSGGYEQERHFLRYAAVSVREA